MFYATAISDTVGLIKNPVLPRNEAIVVFMLTIATLISITCKIDTGEVLNASTFKAGMSACVCVLGVAWLGDTFVKAHISDIQAVAGDLLHSITHGCWRWYCFSPPRCSTRRQPLPRR